MATHLTNKDNLINAGFEISNKIDDKKLEVSINEAEQIHVKPRITDALYLDLLKWVDATDKSIFPAIYEKLMNGGEWQSGGCCNTQTTRQFNGLINVVNYYTYARLINRADDNTTRFGFVQKNDEHSTSDLKIKQAAYNNALHTADIFMNDVILFLNDNSSEIPLFKRAGAAKNRLSILTIK